MKVYKIVWRNRVNNLVLKKKIIIEMFNRPTDK